MVRPNWFNILILMVAIYPFIVICSNINDHRRQITMLVESLTFNEQQCPVSISDKTSYWNLTGISATLLPRCLLNFKAIRWFKLPISRVRFLTRSYDKASYRILKRGRGGCNDKFAHDDVIKWKHFPRNWPFVRGIHRSPVNSPHKASDAELWCLLWSAPE